jgi:ferredoxin
MRIEADLTLCQGHAQCEEAAPEVFEVDDEGYVRVLAADPPEPLRDKVEQAIRRCPVAALKLTQGQPA